MHGHDAAAAVDDGCQRVLRGGRRGELLLLLLQRLARVLLLLLQLLRAGRRVVAGSRGGAAAFLQCLAELGRAAAAARVGRRGGDVQVGQAGLFRELAVVLRGAVGVRLVRSLRGFGGKGFNTREGRSGYWGAREGGGAYLAAMVDVLQLLGLEMGNRSMGR